MAINVSKACDGTFYPFTERITLDNNLIANKLGKFVTDVTVDGTYVLDSEENVYIDSILTYDILFPCDRCLADVIKKFSIKFTASFYLDGRELQEGFFPYNNNVVDITEGVSQEVLLKLPSRVLCNINCKGLCPDCGINLNEGTCNCTSCKDTSNGTKNNPFSVLKDINKFTGGASNGSTKG